MIIIKFIYSEKVTKFWEIPTVDLTGTTKDKFLVEISQIFVAFSEYMNFMKGLYQLEERNVRISGPTQ